MVPVMFEQSPTWIEVNAVSGARSDRLPVMFEQYHKVIVVNAVSGARSDRFPVSFENGRRIEVNLFNEARSDRFPVSFSYALFITFADEYSQPNLKSLVQPIRLEMSPDSLEYIYSKF